jgi:hypothetical protein
MLDCPLALHVLANALVQPTGATVTLACDFLQGVVQRDDTHMYRRNSEIKAMHKTLSTDSTQRYTLQYRKNTAMHTPIEAARHCTLAHSTAKQNRHPIQRVRNTTQKVHRPAQPLQLAQTHSTLFWMKHPDKLTELFVAHMTVHNNTPVRRP